MLRRVLFLLAVVGSAAAISASGSAATTKLVGTFGPGFTIHVTMGGKAVKTLKAGTYTLVVRDTSSIHNFHLFGPGVNKKTGVSSTGTQTWTLKLKAGTYRYQCDVHVSFGMKGSFKVM
jgi:plastocyanin